MDDTNLETCSMRWPTLTSSGRRSRRAAIATAVLCVCSLATGRSAGAQTRDQDITYRQIVTEEECRECDALNQQLYIFSRQLTRLSDLAQWLSSEIDRLHFERKSDSPWIAEYQKDLYDAEERLAFLRVEVPELTERVEACRARCYPKPITTTVVEDDESPQQPVDTGNQSPGMPPAGGGFVRAVGCAACSESAALEAEIGDLGSLIDSLRENLRQERLDVDGGKKGATEARVKSLAERLQQAKDQKSEAEEDLAACQQRCGKVRLVTVFPLDEEGRFLLPSWIQKFFRVPGGPGAPQPPSPPPPPPPPSPPPPSPPSPPPPSPPPPPPAGNACLLLDGRYQGNGSQFPQRGCGIGETNAIVNANQVNLAPFGDGDEEQRTAVFAIRPNNRARATHLRIFREPNHDCELTCAADGSFTLRCTNTRNGRSCTETFQPNPR